MSLPNITPTMPGTHWWVQGGYVFNRASRVPILAPDGAEVWCWDGQTGDRVTDLLDQFANPITVLTVSGGLIEGAGVPVAVTNPVFSLGQYGPRLGNLPVQMLINAGNALAPTDAQVTTLWNNTGSDFRTAADADLNATYETGAGLVLHVSPGGNDSRNGKTWGTAKATVAAALTALGGSTGTILLDHGVHAITNLTVPYGVTLLGRGWWMKRDALGTFGDADYADASNYGGTVLRSTATTGVAIATSGGSLTRQAAAIHDLLLIGPGSGTSTGIKFGNASGDGAFEATWRNVGVQNFSVGVAMTCVEDCDFYGLRIMGCTTGLTLATATNQNAFVMLDIQKCVTGLNWLDATCHVNTFYSCIWQSNTGVCANVQGKNNHFVQPYVENPSGIQYAFEVDGSGHVFDNPALNNQDLDGIHFKSTSSRCWVTGISKLNFTSPIADDGNFNTFEGDTGFITGTGTNRVTIDANSGRTRFASGVSVGDPNAAGVQSFFKADASATSSTGLQLAAAGVVGWQHYIAGGNLTVTYLRDVVNGRMHVTYTRGTTAAAALTDFASGVKVQGPFGANGATPVGKAANPGTATGTDAAVINAVVTALRNAGIVT